MVCVNYMAFYHTVNVLDQGVVCVCVVSGINDKHIWFSVCGRPCRSNFTRAQRLVCCLTLVLGYLISNIMFYGIEPSPHDWRLRVGPVHITRTEIAIGNARL